MKWIVGIAAVMLIAHYFFKRAERRALRERRDPPQGQ
jgi:uncharacterized membrane protein YuzA (DUF378 family)